MLTVFWNPGGFQVVIILPTGPFFNAAWFLDGNLVPLRDHFFPGGRRSDQKKLIVHVDNASPHTGQITETFYTQRAPQACSSLYLPETAPSDFCLFGNVKNKVIGRSVQDEKELLHEVIDILGSILTSELQDVFRNWMNRLEGIIETHGEYVS
jgi:hypothetical protein